MLKRHFASKRQAFCCGWEEWEEWHLHINPRGNFLIIKSLTSACISIIFHTSLLPVNQSENWNIEKLSHLITFKHPCKFNAHFHLPCSKDYSEEQKLKSKPVCFQDTDTLQGVILGRSIELARSNDKHQDGTVGTAILPSAGWANTASWHERQVLVVQLLLILRAVLVDGAPRLPFPLTEGGLGPLGSSGDEKVDTKDEI